VVAQQTPQKQNTPKAAPAKEAPKSEKVNLFAPSWDSGEVKMCSTYDNSPYLLLCDDKAFSELIGNATEEGVLSGKTKAMTKEEREDYVYEIGFNYAVTHSKMFYVRFSERVWPKVPTKQRKLALWECTKEKEITCTRLGGHQR
jgi:hypothetical protein